VITTIDHLIVSVGSSAECTRFVELMRRVGFGPGEKRVMGEWVEGDGRRVAIPASDETVLFRSGAYIEFLYATGEGCPEAWFAERVPRIQGIVFNSTDFEADMERLGLFSRFFSAAGEQPIAAGSAGPEYYPTASVYPVIAARAEPPNEYEGDLPRLTRLTFSGQEVDRWRELLAGWFDQSPDADALFAEDLELVFEVGDAPAVSISATFAVEGVAPAAIPLATGSFSFVNA
jgi:hypothetical protein